jgi:hypothetical protein
MCKGGFEMRGTCSLFLILLLAGCTAGNPVTPETNQPTVPSKPETVIQPDNRVSWGEWTWFIPETHDRVDIAPVRSTSAHMNVLKLIETECDDCLKITDVTNNGDSTIDVTVRLKHPRPTQPQYTGFDVKGILIFNTKPEWPLFFRRNRW